jgi:hypothetical protein
VDDEYSKAGVEDPRILITTSRDPSSKLLQFAKVRIIVDAAASSASPPTPLPFSPPKKGIYIG